MNLKLLVKWLECIYHTDSNLIIGGLLAWLGMRFLLKSKYDSVLQEAEKEAEVIKKNKMLEVKEKFLHLKSGLGKTGITA